MKHESIWVASAGTGDTSMYTPNTVWWRERGTYVSGEEEEMCVSEGEDEQGSKDRGGEGK